MDIGEQARAAAEALNRDDFDEFLDYMHPEVEFQSLIAEADGGTFHGHDGVRRWWGGVRGAFQDVDWEYRRVDQRGAKAVCEVHIAGTLSGVDVRQTMWQVVEMRDGKAGWWRFFRTEEEARAAAGFDQ